jgi:uncharacterized membrane protein YoaT (DUF817 family)
LHGHKSGRVEGRFEHVPLQESDQVRKSAAATWAPLARFIAAEARLGHWAGKRRGTAFLYEFLRFGVKQGWACLFGGIMVGLLIATYFVYPRGAWLARYDFLFLAAVAVQVGMLYFRLETTEEAKVILLFHIVGTVMEVFKTAVGSWVYPEYAFFRVAGVPLFSGFMYASIGSYIARCWRLFEFRFTRHPPLWALYLVSVAIYVNFFAHHYALDVRPILFLVIAILFGRSWVHYRVWHETRRMPLLIGLFLVALFIWFAENIGTLTRTWLYPNQRVAWSMVSLGKLSSWFLLLIISYVMVAAVNRPRAYRGEARAVRGRDAAVMPAISRAPP